MINLKVGDKVIWRGVFGNGEPQVVVVTGLKVTKEPLSKYGGKSVKQVTWVQIKAMCVLLDLENGHWAYSNQIEPYTGLGD